MEEKPDQTRFIRSLVKLSARMTREAINKALVVHFFIQFNLNCVQLYAPSILTLGLYFNRVRPISIVKHRSVSSVTYHCLITPPIFHPVSALI